MKKAQQTNLLIVGGGLGGLSLAIACARVGLDVVCLDRVDLQTRQLPEFDGRTTALSYASKQVLKGIGVWDDLAPQAEPILDIRVADQNSPLYVHYDHQDLGDEPMGYVAENRYITQSLLAAVDALPNLHYITGAEVQTIDRQQASITAQLTDGRLFCARLLVGADGRGSFCRKWAGIQTNQWGYGQSAIVSTIHHENPHHGIAIEHFFPTGPFALLPLTGQRSSLIWSMKEEYVPYYLGLDEQDFCADLEEKSGGYLGKIRLDFKPIAFPLTLVDAQSYTAPRLALISEAAHGMHPIAGQGLNLGFRDVAVLAELIVEAARIGQDIGGATLLNAYSRRRRFDNVFLLGSTDALTWLFSNDIAPISAARKLGLGVVNRLPGVKKLFMRHAMGTLGELPKLVRGKTL